MLLNGQHWLLRPEFFEAMAAIEAAGIQTHELERAAFVERTSEPDTPKFRTSEGGIAHIPVLGALTNSPDFFFSFFGGGNTVYGDIAEGVRAANADPNIERIVLEVSSPGGDIAGLYDTATAIADSAKPVEAHVTDLAASAAYGLAASADKIVLNNPMALVGSIGVVATLHANDYVVRVASTDAPKKVKDPTTAAGIKAIRDELDPLHEEFAGMIARGRGVTVAEVNKKFGKGGLVMGAAAVAAGMADSVFENKSGSTAPAKGTGGTAMDLETLKAEHPALYAAVMAAGVEQGIAQEQERVQAHVIAGEAAGPEGIKLALKFIADGSDYTKAPVQAQYNAAAAKAAALTARGTEDGDLADPDKPEDDEAAKAAKEEKAEKAMLARVAERSGIDPGKIGLGESASA
jgi:ClpP class serine protease